GGAGRWTRSIGSTVRLDGELRLDGEARPDVLQAVDDHPLARLQALSNLPQPVVHLAQVNGPGDDLVPILDDVEDLLARVAVEGALADQQGPVRRADARRPVCRGAPGTLLIWSYPAPPPTLSPPRK